MPEKTDYKIISEWSKTAGIIDGASMKIFTDEVREALATGWKLQGGVSVAYNHDNVPTIYQAVCK